MESVRSTGGWPEPVVMEFPANTQADSPAKVPLRIKRRLLETRTGSSPSSVEEIDTKLKEAGLRRKRFHEWLSYKARPKPRSPSWSSQEEDLGQRLEAKLNAAEQKRLNLLEKARKKLARLDELRQAAKNDVETRMEKEREELENRVESRVRQAEANRIRLLTASSQRRAALRERTARSLFQRNIRETRYKERVRSAMRQKRAAAERKRMELLEAEKGRAHERVMRARGVAKIVCSTRESERKRMEQHLHEKLQRAKTQRAEYLKQRGSPKSPTTRSIWNKQGDLLSRKLAKCWRRFVRSRRTTYSLTKSYENLEINSKSVKSMPFERLAFLIESPSTLQSTKSILDRLESRFTLSQATLASSAPQNIDHLLKHIGSPKKSKRATKGKPVPAKINPSRYSVRFVLCAYMILGHPSAVFSGRGEREISLVDSASEFIKEFELLLEIILNGSEKKEITFRGQLATFDLAWCNYLYRFVAWKVKDARALEDDLVRAACKLELSMMQTCKVSENGDTPQLSHDRKAIQKQVMEDQNLLREKVYHLSGGAGLERMESALGNTRSKFFELKDSSTPLVAHIVSPPSEDPPSEDSASSSSSSVQNYISAPAMEPAKGVVRSLFGPGKGVEVNSSGLRGESEKSPTENEILVNEMLHETNGISIADGISLSSGGDMEIKGKVKEAMEKAFWDGVMESLKGENPDYTQVLSLVKEVRDELCDLAPKSWKNEITDRMDLDILSQVLESGIRDRQYLGQILEFSLGTLRKLSSLANEEEMKVTHVKLLTELGEISISAPENEKNTSFVLSLVKGLRFTLKEIQKLKQEVSKARIQMLEPLVQGKAGIEYLQKAFSDRYGPASDASADKLPLTASWISGLSANLDQEWGDYLNSLSALGTNNAQPIVTTLRTGGAISVNQALSLANTSSVELPECNGDIIDKLVRLGLLKLASGVEGVTVNSVPETFKLNALRLRSIQSEYQKIIVISTSMLVLRQILISEKFPCSETSVSETVQKLVGLVDSSADVGIDEIVETLINTSENLQSKREIMTRVLLKSLQNGDIIFNKVSSAIYTAFKAIVLAGNGAKGRKLAELALKKVGGAVLLDRVVNAGQVLVKMAVLSGQVHGLWYNFLVHEEI